MVLNSNEQLTYNVKFINVVPKLNAGIYYIADFFGSDPSVPRIAKKFYQDVNNGVFKNVSLAGVYSREGYLIS